MNLEEAYQPLVRLACIWRKHTSRWCGWHENDSKHTNRDTWCGWYEDERNNTNRDTTSNANDNHYQYRLLLGVIIFMSLMSLIALIVLSPVVFAITKEFFDTRGKSENNLF